MNSLLRQKIFLVALVCIGCTTLGFARSKPVPLSWVGSWASSQQIPEPNNALSPDDLRDATVRQIVHLSVGGKILRVHLSNAFGTMPLHIASVHIARPVSPSEAKIDIATDKPLAFSGRDDVIIPAGAEYISDPVAYPVAPLSDLAITLHLDTPPEVQTGHPGSRSTSYLVPATWSQRRICPMQRQWNIGIGLPALT